MSQSEAMTLTLDNMDSCANSIITRLTVLGTLCQAVNVSFENRTPNGEVAYVGFYKDARIAVGN